MPIRSLISHTAIGCGGVIAGWLIAAGMTPGPVVRLPGDPLTVNLWPAIRDGGADTSNALQAPVPALSTSE